MKKTRTLSLVLVALLWLPASALAAPAGNPRPGSLDIGQVRQLLETPRALARYLRLSNEQVAQMNTLLRALQTAVEPLRQARAGLCQQLRTSLAASPADAATVGRDSLAVYQNKQQVSAARASFDTSFRAILNTQQRARYDALLQLFNSSPERNANPLGDCPSARS